MFGTRIERGKKDAEIVYPNAWDRDHDKAYRRSRSLRCAQGLTPPL